MGGAKLALGLQHVVPAAELAVMVNTGDDFEHLGLYICPDLDTTIYTLSGIAHPEQGWGRADETWNCNIALAEYGAETWFRLGDKDLALHLSRTVRLARGERLTPIIQDVTRRRGIAVTLLPATDDRVRTKVVTAGGTLDFQQYFVRERCAPKIQALRFDGAAAARITPEVAALLTEPALAAIIICPSNPYLSIDPILAIPALRRALATAAAPILAVTPLIQGAAVKGPTAKIMDELGISRSPASIVAHYGGLIDGFVLDVRDASEASSIDVPVCIADTLMTTLDDRVRLAQAALDFAVSLPKRHCERRP